MAEGATAVLKMPGIVKETKTTQKEHKHREPIKAVAKEKTEPQKPKLEQHNPLHTLSSEAELRSGMSKMSLEELRDEAKIAEVRAELSELRKGLAEQARLDKIAQAQPKPKKIVAPVPEWMRKLYDKLPPAIKRTMFWDEEPQSQPA